MDFTPHGHWNTTTLEAALSQRGALDTVVVCPLTSRLHPQWRTRIQIQCAGNASEIAVDQIRTIGKQRLKQKLDQLFEDKVAQLRKVITDMYG